MVVHKFKYRTPQVTESEDFNEDEPEVTNLIPESINETLVSPDTDSYNEENLFADITSYPGVSGGVSASEDVDPSGGIFQTTTTTESSVTVGNMTPEVSTANHEIVTTREMIPQLLTSYDLKITGKVVKDYFIANVISIMVPDFFLSVVAFFVCINLFWTPHSGLLFLIWSMSTYLGSLHNYSVGTRTIGELVAVILAHPVMKVFNAMSFQIAVDAFFFTAGLILLGYTYSKQQKGNAQLGVPLANFSTDFMGGKGPKRVKGKKGKKVVKSIEVMDLVANDHSVLESHATTKDFEFVTGITEEEITDLNVSEYATEDEDNEMSKISYKEESVRPYLFNGYDESTY